MIFELLKGNLADVRGFVGCHKVVDGDGRRSSHLLVDNGLGGDGNSCEEVGDVGSRSDNEA